MSQLINQSSYQSTNQSISLNETKIYLRSLLTQLQPGPYHDKDSHISEKQHFRRNKLNNRKLIGPKPKNVWDTRYWSIVGMQGRQSRVSFHGNSKLWARRRTLYPVDCSLGRE